MRVQVLGDDHAERALAELGRKGSVALVGSAVSTWEPSGLPNGASVTWSLGRVLAEVDGRFEPSVAKLVGRCAFEHVMDACPRPDVLGSNLATLYRGGLPNALHASLVRLLARGALRHVVTTNYDTCIEQAWCVAASAPAGLQVVVDAADVSSLDFARPVLFKIHGCAARDTARPGTTRSMVFRLAQEGVLPEWKRLLLRRLVRGHPLLVCGYSGLDFEICPELPSIGASSICWNTLADPRHAPDTMSDNARRVVATTDGTVIVGDMLALWSAFGVPVTAVWPAETDIRTRLVAGLDAHTLDAWRLKLFGGIGCADAGLRVGRRLLAASHADPRFEFEARYGLAQALFHRGLYVQAAREYSAAVRAAERASERGACVGAEIGAYEAERCCGRWLRAWRRLRRLAADPATQKHPTLALRETLMLRQLYRICRNGRLQPLATWLRARCRILLRRTAENAALAGQWFDLQHCMLTAARVDLRPEDVYTGPLTPLPAREGYRQIGYVVAESMAVRDRLRLSPGVDSGLASDDLCAKLEQLLEIGAAPEAWKLARAIERARGRCGLPHDLRRRARAAFRSCEYSTLMRRYLLWTGD